MLRELCRLQSAVDAHAVENVEGIFKGLLRLKSVQIHMHISRWDGILKGDPENSLKEEDVWSVILGFKPAADAHAHIQRYFGRTGGKDTLKEGLRGMEGVRW